MNIVYHPGKKNTNADALSRSPQLQAPVFGEAETEVQVSTVTEDETTSIDELLKVEPNNTLSNPHSFTEEQRKDGKIVQVISFLQTAKFPSDEMRAIKIALQASFFTIEDRGLYFFD